MVKHCIKLQHQWFLSFTEGLFHFRCCLLTSLCQRESHPVTFFWVRAADCGVHCCLCTATRLWRASRCSPRAEILRRPSVSGLDASCLMLVCPDKAWHTWVFYGILFMNHRSVGVRSSEFSGFFYGADTFGKTSAIAWTWPGANACPSTPCHSAVMWQFMGMQGGRSGNSIFLVVLYEVLIVPYYCTRFVPCTQCTRFLPSQTNPNESFCLLNLWTISLNPGRTYCSCSQQCHVPHGFSG